MRSKNLKTLKLSAFFILFLFIFFIYLKASVPNFYLTVLNNFAQGALAPPHGGCNSCHILHTAPGAQLGMIDGNANLCISCHNPVGAAYLTPFTNTDKAVPGTGGTSHAWNIQAVNTVHEANVPSDFEMARRVINDTIVCSTCHDQHSQTYAPFLRASNTGDAMCKDCHSARDVGIYSSNPSVNKGSHPVGVIYNGVDPGYHTSPTDANILVVGSNVECSSCHKLHYAATNDGYLLRATNDDNLCQSCHTYGSHKSMGCTTCHQTHNTDKTNIYMIRNTITTPSSGNKTVVFKAETGINSFADGNGTYDGVCEVCHTTPIHHTNTDDGGTHQDATNCMSCHPHNRRFYPQTQCLTCHSSTQGSRRIIAGASGDFVRSSHHANNVQDEDCVTCHFMGNHMNGTVQLMDPDQGDLLVYNYDAGNKAGVENFCLNCHDTNGVNGDTSPFTDNVVVPVVDNTMWSASSHKNSPYTCMDCHDNGHGSNKGRLLGPYTKIADGTADPMDDEEEFCENCHSGTGVASSDVASEFNLTHSHQVDEVLEYGTNSGLECTNCHNPHYNTSAYKTSNPDNNSLLWTGSEKNFCITCHDGTPPAGITFPTTTNKLAVTFFGQDFGTGWDKSSYDGSRHDAQFPDTGNDCQQCHEKHGSNNYSILRGTYLNTDRHKVGTYTSNDYTTCFQSCHLSPPDNVPFGFHEYHVYGDFRINCIHCHDVHASRELKDGGISEAGLIDWQWGFDWCTETTFQLLGGRTMQTSFMPSGSCYIDCHYMNHNPETY